MVSDRLHSRSTLTGAGFRELAPHLAAEHLGELRVIDVREPGEFTGPLGRVPGAELVPLGTVEEAARSWNRDVPVLVVCRSGGRSGRAASILRTLGFRNVFNLTGGMLAWDAHGLPRDRIAA